MQASGFQIFLKSIFGYRLHCIKPATAKGENWGGSGEHLDSDEVTRGLRGTENQEEWSEEDISSTF